MSKDRAPLLDEHQQVLVEQAKRLPVGDFTMVMRRWASLADDQLAKDTFMEKWQRRHLHLSTTLDGWISGDLFLDPVAGETLINVLDHLVPPDPQDAPDRPRPLSQRRADALTDLAGSYLNGGKPGRNRPNVNITADIATTTGHNLILLCRRHHTLIHNTQWTIEQTPNGDYKFTHPARAP